MNFLIVFLEGLVLCAGEGSKGHVKRALMTVTLAGLVLMINFALGEMSWHNVSIILLVAAFFWALMTTVDTAVKALKRSGES
ncbi:MAG TPA: hypothetical protein VJL90_14550 [Pseudorhodoplanes sp.]|nr:hypothetical protein [Pseudorhodoplanes sp.]